MKEQELRTYQAYGPMHSPPQSVNTGEIALDDRLSRLEESNLLLAHRLRYTVDALVEVHINLIKSLQ